MRSRRRRLKGGMLRSLTRCCRRAKPAPPAKEPSPVASPAKEPSPVASPVREPSPVASPVVASKKTKKNKKREVAAARAEEAIKQKERENTRLANAIVYAANNGAWTEVAGPITRPTPTPKSRLSKSSAVALLTEGRPSKSSAPAPKSYPAAPITHSPQSVIVDVATSGQLKRIISTIKAEYISVKYDKSYLNPDQKGKLSLLTDQLRSKISAAEATDKVDVLKRIKEDLLGITNAIDQIIEAGQKVRAERARVEAAEAKAAEAKAIANAEAEVKARLSAKVEQLGSGLAGLSPKLLRLAALYVIRSEDGNAPVNNASKSERFGRTVAHKTQKNRNHIMRVRARIQEKQVASARYY